MYPVSIVSLTDSSRPLFRAIKPISNIKTVQRLLSVENFDINQRIPIEGCHAVERTGTYFLREALSFNAKLVEERLEVLKLLLQAGANPNLQDDYQETVLYQVYLMFSSQKLLDQTAAKAYLKLFLLWGADPTIKNFVGQTAFEYSEEFGDLIRSIQAEMFQLITTAGKADLAALRAFFKLTAEEKFKWERLSIKLTAILPRELVDEINGLAFAPALDKYSFSLANFREYRKNFTLLTETNHPVTPTFKK